MKALSQAQKSLLYQQCVYGRLRWLAKPCYDLILTSQLLANRFIDLFTAKNQTDLGDLTLLIKTFERPYALKRLLNSIKRLYPNVKIIIVDDSHEPAKFDGVEMLILTYDSGISAGRNAALDMITTKYFLLLDDDFVFSRRQRLGELIEQMEEYPEIDILGGRCIDLPLYITHNFQESLSMSKVAAKTKIGTMLGNNKVVEKTQNYFIAKTESVKKVKWNDSLKINEHTDFFNRAHGKLTTTYRPDMLILHAKTPFDIAYLTKRYRFTKQTKQ